MLGRNVKPLAVTRFELQGGPFDNIPIRKISIKRTRGSTPSGLGSGEEGKHSFNPTPLTGSIESIDITFVITDQTNELYEWAEKCSSNTEREVERHQITVLGYGDTDEPRVEHVIERCYAETPQDAEHDSASTGLAEVTYTLRGNSIRSEIK
ncbi:MAG: hypothetical protein CLLPBCKN_006854 [Chroococcidiopsis cubana SAG 39.79]|uniref:Phage tail protein n=1 Tax=Chroococcidiopsis cubana SAG 39.79 TaxID=388085 RepID=A0AB37UIN8_9CYAN|nr:hypothetical protein [Chroococcidiopsis cubana]MDZ4877419.1 hypothetical protein [Chroococcidiopsis cubana SAG 39.79]PSB59544.1 hypothetical protein C7B79_28810 [Chroococcidiopsis cubana CCALA 043]RUT11241.1 hypothetical protein DSM107010_35100 [Chroococcidiopsis cubana SAG 39.79]